MNPLLPTLATLSAAMAGSLLSAIWEGAVLAACVAICLRFLPRLSAAARWIVWTNLFLLLLSLHLLPFFGAHLPSGRELQASPFHLGPLWSMAIAALWLLLSLGRGWQLIAAALHLRALAGRATPIQPCEWIQTLLQTGKNRLLAQLCTSTEVERPCVAGFLHPRILLPLALYRQLSPSELEQVLLHEMEHLRRADHWSNLLQKAAIVLFPLNPVLFWVERQLCAEREFACDDRVLRSNFGKKSYALCLARLAEIALFRRGLSLALGAWERRPELARRIHRILQRSHQSMRRGPAAVLTGCLLLAILAGALALACTPQLVSFAPLPQPAMQASSSSASDFPPIRHTESGAHPTLVKAILPQPGSSNASRINRRPGTSLKQSRQLSRPAPNPDQFIVMTEWVVNAPQPRILFAVQQVDRFTYAAVPVAHGWLIVQI